MNAAHLNPAPSKSQPAGALHTPINYIQKAEARIMAVLRADPAERQITDLADALDALKSARLSLVTPIENDKRGELRLAHSVASYFQTPDGIIVDCEIVDLSAGGAMIALDYEVDAGTTIMLSIPLGGALKAVVIDCDDQHARLRFPELTEECVEAIRRLTWTKLAG
ncbi:MAG: PilZ domain-containing protein [Rhodospirillaceae bacterium]|nr:PilZ domain-containing protein [Rhodospirillaceae bacterium]